MPTATPSKHNLAGIRRDRKIFRYMGSGAFQIGRAILELAVVQLPRIS